MTDAEAAMTDVEDDAENDWIKEEAWDHHLESQIRDPEPESQVYGAESQIYEGGSQVYEGDSQVYEGEMPPTVDWTAFERMEWGRNAFEDEDEPEDFGDFGTGRPEDFEDVGRLVRFPDGRD